MMLAKHEGLTATYDMTCI